MTDKEQLELAAKAAGIPPSLYKTRNGMVWEPAKQDWRRAWNPLTNDGDALRLAVKLAIDTVTGGGRTIAYCQGLQACQYHGDDPYAATRRAILRAAAEIGKGMK